MTHRYDEGRARGMSPSDAAGFGHGAGADPADGGGGGTISRFFDAQGNQLLVSEIKDHQFVKDANGIFYIPQFDDLGNFTGVDLASASQQDFLSEQTGGGTGTSGPAPPAFSGTSAGLTQQHQQDLDFLREKERLARESGDATAAQDFQNQIALLEQQQEFDKQQAEANRQFTAEENRLAEEAALKRNRLGVLSDLIQTFAGVQSQARDTLANLQPDPFRFAAVSGGVAPFGVTPQQGFQQQLTDIVSAPIPQLDPNAPLPSIESAIQGLTGAQVPLPPQTFGMAGGGTIPMPFNGTSARLVGERGPEVMVTGPQGVTILPLGKGAQEGGFFPFKPIEFDKETLFPALQTSGLFGSLGIPDLPRRTGFGEAGETITGGFGELRQLGIAPKFVRDISTGAIWRISNGVRQHISGPAAPIILAGLNPADVVGATTGEISQLAPQVGPALRAPQEERARQVQAARGSVPFTPGDVAGRQPVPTSQPSAFTKFSVPIVEPTTGVLLPAPFAVAEQLNKLRVTNPFMFNLMLSAYRSADVPVDAIFGSIQSGLSFGQEQGAVGLR